MYVFMNVHKRTHTHTHEHTNTHTHTHTHTNVNTYTHKGHKFNGHTNICEPRVHLFA
jgi:hypothetical protein